MDFKRIANIFILAFGLLNVYLIVSIVGRVDIQDTTTQPNGEDLISSLSSSNITLPDLEETEVAGREVYSLQINAHELLETTLEESDNLSGTIDENGVYYESFPSNPIVLEGTPSEGFTEEDIETIEAFILSENVMYGAEYSNRRYDETGRRFVFNQVIDGVPISDGTSEISLFVNEEGEIFAFQQTYAGPVTRQGNPLRLINGQRAIEILFLNNEIRQGSEVLQPELTYRRALHLEDLSMYSPAWVIQIEYASERSTFRVDAVNGTIIRQPVASSDRQENSSEEDNEENDEESDNDTDS